MSNFVGRAAIFFKKLFPFSLLLVGCAIGRCETPPRTAFFYGKPLPSNLEALSRYDRIVVEAESFTADQVRYLSSKKKKLVFAYVSVGEAEGWRKSTSELKACLFIGENSAWGSRIADLTKQGWRDFLIEQRMKTLWDQGYRGFFLDTLDSYQLITQGEDEKQATQEAALVEIIQKMHERFPTAKLLLNRGFKLLPNVGTIAAGVVAESLFQSWNTTTGKYVAVKESDSAWLLDRLNEASKRYNLPITVIDYVDPEDAPLGRATAERIQKLGFSPWIAKPSLDTILN